MLFSISKALSDEQAGSISNIILKHFIVKHLNFVTRYRVSLKQKNFKIQTRFILLMRVFFIYCTMEISKSEIKLINALGKSHGRKKHQAFLVEGVKMIEELFQSGFEIILLAGTSTWQESNLEISSQKEFRLITNNVLQKLSSFSTSNQVMAIAKTPQQLNLIMEQDDLVLVLDTIQDPGNMGTIIRTADWFGIDKIICSKETVDAYSSKVVQSSMGSLFRTRIYYTNLPEFFDDHGKNQAIYGSLLSGDNIYQIELKKSGFIIIGNESKGISEELQAYINQAIFIPRAKNSKAESLNAAIACSIILSEFSK